MYVCQRAHSLCVLVVECCEYIQCSSHLNSNIVMFDCCGEVVVIVFITNIVVCICVRNIAHQFGIVVFYCCESVYITDTTTDDVSYIVA